MADIETPPASHAIAMDGENAFSTLCEPGKFVMKRRTAAGNVPSAPPPRRRP